MASSSSNDQRSARLNKLLGAYIGGQKSPKTSGEGKLLLEAIVAQQDKTSCVERLVGSKNAFGALKLALRFDVTSGFINSTLKDFLIFLKDPAVAQACGGELLKKLLNTIVQPDTLWSAFLSAYRNRELNPESELAFAWLLLELISWVEDPPMDVDSVAQDLTDRKVLLNADDRDLRSIGYRIQHVLLGKSNEDQLADFGPGGRHDNDYTNFRKIAICPTEDELTNTKTAFYRPANAIDQQPFPQRPGVQLDNQFRLLREDFLAELRDDMGATQGRGKGRRHRPGARLQGLSLVGAYCGNSKFRTPFALVLSVKRGLEDFARLKRGARKAFLKDKPKFLKHQSFGCVMDHNRIITFATLLRVEELLVQQDDDDEIPLVVLRAPDRATLENLLATLKSSNTAEFVMVDTAIFAYEPVLRCLQSTTELPLWEELFAVSPEEVEASVRISTVAPLDLLDDIEADKGADLQSILSLPKSVVLDQSQMNSLLAGLRQSVSLIQGPPGTGKSFIGALLAQALFKFTKEKILVICYTNHALDQFLEDLLDIGIPADHMVRLGAKSTARTESLQLSKQAPPGHPPWNLIDSLKSDLDEYESSAKHLLDDFQSFKPDTRSLMEYLEFSEDDSDFFSAFQMPDHDPEEHVVGKGGKKVTESYLYDRWRHGQDAGIMTGAVFTEHNYVWAMDKAARQQKMRAWTQELLQERISGIGSHAESYDRSEDLLRNAWDQKVTKILQAKRVIACTTTGAAKYTKQLRSDAPGIVIVEEAGEILESHVLTALTPSTKQLILIGDHQQLRPKVNNYALTVEKGEGYDLNRSLFERLILAGIPHTTLSQQHRMCPEISSLVRHLTYPDLTDAPSTLTREPMKGIDSRVVFVDHRYLELASSQMADRSDQGSSASKQNPWEASMVLKIVRYMAQQGYGTADQVVLTPYLGQLNLLRQELSKENDPVLNDLDSNELMRAGISAPHVAGTSKRPIQISTIDNYQGEESGVVIVSMTRSNKSGDIGFMSAAERLNVLLSRARKALIIIGNSETFLASRQGKHTWRPLFDMLSKTNSIHEGFPVRCEQHPERQGTLTQPSDFDERCPDGGCSAPCDAKLKCGLHDCPKKCHILADHAKIPCKAQMTDECPKNHQLRWICSELRPASCPTCDADARAAEERAERNLELDKIQQEKQAAYAAQLAAIQAEIDCSRRRMREQAEDEERDMSLRLRRLDLENARRQANQAGQAQNGPTGTSADNTAPATQPQTQSTASKPNTSGSGGNPPSGSGGNPASGNGGNSPPGPAAPLVTPISTAQQVWDDQKRLYGDSNLHLDVLMSMIGLESVKEAFLEIKAQVDLAVRQNTSLSKERFGTSLLGNPGTGKTTVARLYANFLTSVGALPGSHFVETTGAKLAHEGVQGAKKILDDIITGGGGALFIDEAYQLTSGNSPGGLAVLDFLLSEVENLTGKVVFILAGYDRNMESFFGHNPGLPSRFPRSIKFADYEDVELLKILISKIEERYRFQMRLEGGTNGLYARILAKRVGRGRGTPGFGNARAVENAMSRVIRQQATRVEKERRNKKMPDDFWFTKEDLIGPEPSGVLKSNKSWTKLQQLIGLSSVKDSVTALFHSINFNYHRELEEKPLLDFSLNKVFYGSPGTGKTTVAYLYGQILADIGMLSSNEVILKTPADFIGSVIGASEANTKKILDRARGKVLVIDEAYGLCDTNDPFKTSVIDTIVSEVQNVPGDDRCVLLLGYKHQMEDMMQQVNPGLARRFPIDSGFHFEDFNDAEMATIFDSKLKHQAFVATDKARSVALSMLDRMRNRPNFGNAGQVDILLNDAKLNQQKRLSRGKLARTAILEAEDFDADYKRGERAITNIDMLFQGVIGCDKIIEQMKGYQAIAANTRAMHKDPRSVLPFNFLFRGPPGTGKTTTARKMGKIYFDMGFIATAEVVECSAKDLISGYVGQTGEKTQKLLESALGKVLFIDEAYRLAHGHPGSFEEQALGELCDCITKTRFLNKIVVILAGYDHEIDALLDINPGLSSRFSDSVDFPVLSAEDCFTVLQSRIHGHSHLDDWLLSNPSADFKASAMAKFDELAALSNFANGRDVETISKEIVRDIMKHTKVAGESLTVTEQHVLNRIDTMIAERISRTQSAIAKRHVPQAVTGALDMPQPSQNLHAPSAKTKADVAIETHSTTATASEKTATWQDYLDPYNTESRSDQNDPDHSDGEDNGRSPRSGATRDSGVSDEVWEQLQRDARKAEEERMELQRLAEEEEKLKQWLKQCADAKRQQELEELERKKRALELKLRLEAEEKAKLKRKGLCPMGYHWIKQSGGYRCAGGSHFVSDGQL